MASPITVPENNSPLFQSATVSSLNWRFVPPKFFFYWLMEDAYPAPFTADVEFPAYDLSPVYAGYTNWQVHVDMIISAGASPFLQVEESAHYEGSLGVQFSNGGEYYRKTLNFNFAGLFLLSENSGYFAQARYRVMATSPAGVSEIISEKKLFFELRISAFNYANQSPLNVMYQGRTIQFGPGQPVTYTPMAFSHHLNSAALPAMDLFYFRCKSALLEPTFTPSASIIEKTHVPIHEYYSKFQVSFNEDINALPVGTYNYTITLESSVNPTPTSIVVDVVLEILPEISGIAVTPETLTFDVVVGGPVPDQQILSVASAEAWNIVSAIPSWLQLSQFGGVGNVGIAVIPVNYSELAAGEYSAILEFDCDGDTVTAEVIMNLKIFLLNPFEEGRLYFTKDLNLMIFTTELSGTYIELTVTITTYKINSFEQTQYVRKYNLPLFQKRGEFHVGSIVHELLEEIDLLESHVPSVTSNYPKPQIQPADVQISYAEKVYVVPEEGEPAGLLSSDLPTFLMLKGHGRFITENQTCLLTVSQQSVTRITPRSVISTSFTHFGTPQLIVKKNGNIIDEVIFPAFKSNNEQKVVFSYFRFVNDLKPGDHIELFVINGLQTRIQRFLVFMPGLESTFFFFENQNNVIEAFEFSGRRRVTSNYNHIVTSKVKDLHPFEVKRRSENIQAFTVNTGHLTPVDHHIVDAIIMSNNVWCSFDNPSGPYFKVDATTNKLLPHDTAVTEVDLDVEFNIIENANAVIYPR